LLVTTVNRQKIAPFDQSQITF